MQFSGEPFRNPRDFASNSQIVSKLEIKTLADVLIAGTGQAVYPESLQTGQERMGYAQTLPQ